MTNPGSIPAEKQFTQSWIQALMPSADLAATRTIKPKLELIDRISLNRETSGREEAAQELWDFGQENALEHVLSILPVQSEQWEFPDEERFIFRRNASEAISGFDAWLQHLGLSPGVFSLESEVTNSDWSTLVREQAVKLQKPFDSSAFGHANTLHPKCTGAWDGKLWTIQFEDVPWLKLTYDELPSVPRPDFAKIEDTITFAMGEADRLHSNKQNIVLNSQSVSWQDCIPSLSGLHNEMLRSDGFSPWFRRVWQCVWPVVYREQNVLRGKADLSIIRPELKACLESTPKLSVWMFVFAKLVCMTQTGMGLGINADYAR